MIKRTRLGQFQKGTHWRAKKPFWDKSWCVQEYIVNKKSTGDIAREHGVTDAAVIFWLKKHGIKRRSVSEARSQKRWGSFGPDNPMWNKKGELSPNWKGGITADRQAFYAGRGWKSACALVWKRDNATCQRCHLHRGESLDMPFHIHHITSFKVVEKRADPNNLVLLCEGCHIFVHSKLNTKKQFIEKLEAT
jgi:transposase-like protein